MRQAAQSAAAAGFKNIFLMGDHGGGQVRVARGRRKRGCRLAREGRSRLLRLDVNTKAGQQINAYLKEKNIVGGGHAAVAETVAGDVPRPGQDTDSRRQVRGQRRGT